LREIEGLGFEVQGFNEEVLEVSSNMSVLVTISSAYFYFRRGFIY